MAKVPVTYGGNSCPAQEHITTSDRFTRELLRQFKRIINDGRLDYLLQTSPNAISHWHTTPFHAKDTDWEDAMPEFEITLFSQSLNVAHDGHFVETISFHPNGYTNGKVCLDLMQHNCSSADGFDANITFIQTLLIAPNRKP
jgi:ubiquitin-protein ligase